MPFMNFFSCAFTETFTMDTWSVVSLSYLIGKYGEDKLFYRGWDLNKTDAASFEECRNIP